jgi:hypothetical protein
LPVSNRADQFVFLFRRDDASGGVGFSFRPLAAFDVNAIQDRRRSATTRQSDAYDAVRQNRMIIAGLTELSPDNAVWKRDLAWYDEQIAELLR